ncbi:MAG: lysoplasmalogenase [Solobacterium sp.]|nr:lysoplasmalogenase [Solobacterium sp.]
MYFLIPLCLCIMAAFICMEKQEKYVPAVVLKGLASLCFVVLGMKLSPGTSAAKMITAGLLLGCIADVLLNLRYVFQEKGQLVFLLGILVFLSGHIAYLLGIMRMAGNFIICFVLALILTALLMKWIFARIEAKTAFKIFGIFYIGAVVLLNVCAFASLAKTPSMFTGIFAAGALLFLVSDIVLILNTFGPEQKFILRVTNLSLYYAGQILIALSLLYLTV